MGIRRHWDVLLAALKDEKEKRRANGAGRRARRRDLEFLPAALEVMETPASPLGRAVALSLMAFFAIAVAWAVFGRMDIIATAQGNQARAEFRRAVLAQLAEVRRRATSLEQELIKARERSRLRTLTAPVAGVVQQLAVHTVGGAVTPAQELMVIVPADSHIEVESMVLNKDTGFVHSGQ